MKAEHVYVETLEELEEKLRGSKYVQSHIGKSYKQAKDFLKQGRLVVFSGTPCQIAGLRNYLRHDYNNLFTIDLVCHGVPSPMIFEHYKDFYDHHVVILPQTVNILGESVRERLPTILKSYNLKVSLKFQTLSPVRSPIFQVVRPPI